MQYRTMAIIVASILAIGGFHGGPGPLLAAGGVPDTAEVVLLRAPGEGIQPQAVSDQNGVVHLVYFGGEPAAGDLYYTQIGAGKNVLSDEYRGPCRKPWKRTGRLGEPEGGPFHADS